MSGTIQTSRSAGNSRDFPVLVNGAIDAFQQAPRIERFEIFPEVGVGHPAPRGSIDGRPAAAARSRHVGGRRRNFFDRYYVYECRAQVNASTIT
jgi:hypothetical protein